MDVQDRDWRDRAACRGEDPELFFPISNTGPALEQIDRAKAICARCPVIRECLAFALETGQDHGIWGGMTADERRAWVRRDGRRDRGGGRPTPPNTGSADRQPTGRRPRSP